MYAKCVSLFVEGDQFSNTSLTPGLIFVRERFRRVTPLDGLGNAENNINIGLEMGKPT